MSGLLIKPILMEDPDRVQEYWQTLYVHDTLKYRLCDIEKPAWMDVVDMIRRVGRQMYFVLEDYKILGEFMLENQTGGAFQIHFSTHPEISFQKRLQIGKFCVTYLLRDFINPENNEPFVKALYGLTPIDNRAACVYVLKVGFKKLGILPYGMKSRGKIVDAMVSVAHGT